MIKELKRFRSFAFVGLAAIAIAGCGEKPAEPATTTTAGGTAQNTPSTSTPTSQLDDKLATSQLASTPNTPAPTDDQGAAKPKPADSTPVEQRKPKDGEEVAVLETDQGKIILMFFPDKAPNHVKNFKDLTKKGFYDGTKFHRIIPGFMIQGGDPNTKKGDRATWGQGGPETRVNAEFNDIHHGPGILSMARSQDPNSAGSQFFIVVGDAGFLDNQYTAFGKVVTGQDVADKIVALPAEGDLAVNPAVIKKATVQKWPVK